MNRLRTRLFSLVFRNPYTFIASCAIVLGGIILVQHLTFFAYNQYARATFMKPFYAKVALAEKYDQELPLANFVSRATTHDAAVSTKGQGWLENCTVPGTYTDYQTNRQLTDVRSCSYGYISYFWVNALDDTTIDQAAKEMQTAGWTLTDDAASQSVNKERAGTTMLGGYSFTRPDGITADMVFIDKSLQLQNSGSFSGYPYWDFVTSTSDPHNYFLAVDVMYSTHMQGDRLIGN